MKRIITTRVVMLVMILALAACGGSAAEPAAPTSQPALSSEPTPTADLTTGAMPDFVMALQQALAQRLGLEVGDVSLVTVEPVEWPDPCLGIQRPEVLCAAVVTPGYRVTFLAIGEAYVYHTNLDGSRVELATAPAVADESLIVWEQNNDLCDTAVIGREWVASGHCREALISGPLVSSQRAEELAYFIETYAAFEAETAAGRVVFNGQGAADAGPAEQRMIAEWARLVFLETGSGGSDAPEGLALAWHREGGFAGFCDDLSVYLSGAVYASSCGGNEPEALGRGWLAAEQLEQLYEWVDQYQGFEWEQKDPAVADAMTTRLVFSGAGAAGAPDEAQQAMVAFAAELFAAYSQ